MACLSPFYVRVKDRWIPTPCGRCPPCKKRRVDGWVFRLLQEDRRSSSAYFVTLTYENAHVPISPNGFMTLDKKEFPKYMKRLRKLCPGVNLKYYACGEYGSKNHRPHYHAIIFNVPKKELLFDAWHLDGSALGDIHVGDCSGDSIAYCMKYIDKRTPKFHERDDRVPEFSLMSKGLGSNYITPTIEKYHNADLSRMFLTLDGGHKIALPRYYRNRLYDEDSRSEQGYLAELAAGKINSDNYDTFIRLYGDNPAITYGDFVQSQRDSIVAAFYNNQKARN